MPLSIDSTLYVVNSIIDPRPPYECYLDPKCRSEILVLNRAIVKAAGYRGLVVIVLYIKIILMCLEYTALTGWPNLVSFLGTLTAGSPL